MSDLYKFQLNKMFNLSNEWKMDRQKMERGRNGDGRWKEGSKGDGRWKKE